MTLQIDSSLKEKILRKMNSAFVLTVYLVSAYGAYQGAIYLRGYLQTSYVYTSAWEQTIRDECKALKGCKAVTFERNWVFPAAGSSFLRLFCPQVAVTFQIDRALVTRDIALTFGTKIYESNPGTYVRFN